MISTREPHRITARGREDDPTAPIFLMRVPTLDERTLFEAELASPPWNAGIVHPFQLIHALEDAADALATEPDDRARLQEVLDYAQRDPDALDDSGRALLTAFQDTAAAHWPAYQTLIRKQERRRVVGPALALKRFLCGWENMPVAFGAGIDGAATDATLEALSAIDRLWLGYEIQARLYLSADEGKASAPPQSSPSGPATSPADGGQRTAGRAGGSAKTSGRKTRA